MPYPRTTVTTSNRGLIASGRYTEPMANAMRSWLAGVMRRVRDDARAFAPADLGAYRRSILYRTRRRGLVVDGEVYSTDSPVKQAVIEYGRRPGSKMPPSGVLLGWMARHGIPADKEFLIRRAIGRDGIPGKFPFRKAFAKNRGLIQSQSRVLATTVARSLS